jgi:putative glutamine amidotransferase
MTRPCGTPDACRARNSFTHGSLMKARGQAAIWPVAWACSGSASTIARKDTDARSAIVRMSAVVAIATDVRTVEGQNVYAADTPAVDAIAQITGALPLLVPSLGRQLDIDAVLDQVHGLVLPGGVSNVCPSRYGVRPTEDYGPFDPKRDATTLPLIRAALVKGVPLLMICRGFQELNVALGGTLRVEPDHRPEEEKHGTPESAQTEDERYRLRQPLEIAKGGQLFDIIECERIQVNSLHSQLIDELATGLKVEGKADDGSVEAVTVRGAKGFALGVVFHPEYWADQDGPSYAILHAFGSAVDAYATRHAALEPAQ